MLEVDGGQRELLVQSSHYTDGEIEACGQKSLVRCHTISSLIVQPAEVWSLNGEDTIQNDSKRLTWGVPTLNFNSDC